MHHSPRGHQAAQATRFEGGRSGSSFIHHHRLAHRDSKPQDLFIRPDGHVTIRDLLASYTASDQVGAAFSLMEEEGK